MSPVYPVSLVAGDTLRLEFTYKRGASAASAEPVDLTNWSGEFSVAWTPRPGSSVQAGSAVGAIALGGANGKVTATLADTETDDLSPEHDAHYQVRLTDGDGVIKTLLAGPLYISKSPVEISE